MEKTSMWLIIGAIVVSAIMVLGLFFVMTPPSAPDKTQANEETVKTENSSPFSCKKVIFRDDDIGDSDFLPSLEWISNLTISKNIKMTFSVIPANVMYSPKIVDYLNQLDREYFEFATHGYEHIYFRGLPYEEQYSLIENGTKIMEEYLHSKPFTFVPPYGSGDVNTTKVLSALGYHSITDMRDESSYVASLLSDFGYEIGWGSPPPEHCSVETFTSSFDEFYNSSDEYYIVFLHDWSFLDEEGNLNKTKTQNFEEIINYLISKHVQFMTLEELYQWQTDEQVMQIEMINENSYFIDLQECAYDHTIKINPPSTWDGAIYLLDDNTGEETMLNNTVDEFNGIKGHIFYLNHIE